MSCKEISLKEIKQLIPKRKKESHKGDFGKILIFAGSRRYPGAAYLCAQAAVRCGSGLVTLVSDPSVLDILSIKLHEAMVVSGNSDEIPALIQNADAIAFGCGMENTDATFLSLKSILESELKIPIIIDADGINVLAKNPKLIQGKNNVLLTPHEGEFARFLKIDRNDLKGNRKQLAEEFVEKYEVNLLLKGFHTIVARKGDVRINTTGNPKMASGGMGDVLTGMIASFAGQGMDVYTAGCFSAFLHGYCADEKGHLMYSVTASDVINDLPYALEKIKNHDV